MIALTPAVVAKWVETRALNTEMLPLLDVLVDVLSYELRRNSKRTISDEEIAETAEHVRSPVATEILNIYDDYIGQGITPSFVFDADDLYYRCIDTPETSFRQKLAKMTSTGFEFFCKEILDKLNGHSVVSGGSGDSCVDFFSVGLPLLGDIGPFPKTARTIVLGQAKCWKIGREVSEGDLREFIGGALCRRESLKNDYSDHWGLFSPLCFAFWVTCDFSVGGRKYAEKMGIWYLNGKALVQLALRVGITEASIESIEKKALGKKLTGTVGS